MSEHAILAIEEALLATLFTQRALVELLIKKGIIDRHDLEHEILHTETSSVGIGSSVNREYLEKRSHEIPTTKKQKQTKDRRQQKKSSSAK